MKCSDDNPESRGVLKVEAVALETAGETMDKEAKEMGTDSAAFNQGFKATMTLTSVSSLKK